MNNIITYFTYQDKTLFIPFKFIYPECSVLIKDSPQLSTLICLKTDCSQNHNCIEILAKRVHYFFSEIEPLAELMIAYFTHPNYGNSIKAGIFNKDLDEPRVITVNKFAFEKYKKAGIIKQWVARDEFININGLYKLENIIPVTNLIK